jgi:hypothetical protein
LSGRRCGEFGDGFVILFAQVAVDFNERLDGIALVLDIGV